MYWGGKLYLSTRYTRDLILFLLKIDSLQINEMDKQKRHGSIDNKTKRGQNWRDSKNLESNKEYNVRFYNPKFEKLSEIADFQEKL